MNIDKFLDELIKEALEICAAEEISIYTFAMHFDELNQKISLYFDTKENSQKVFGLSKQKISKVNKKEHSQNFSKALANGNIDELTTHSLHEDRNLSLGDFELMDVCRTEIEFSYQDDTKIYISMINAINRSKTDIVKLSTDPNELYLCCSGPLDDAQFVWQV